MPPKTKKPAPKNVKVSAPKKAPAKSKPAARPVKKTAAPRSSGAKKKKTGGFLQTVKKGVQAGIETVASAVKSVTPNVLLPKAGKSKRR